MMAMVRLYVLRPNDMTTVKLLGRASELMESDPPFEVGPRDTVEVPTAGEELDGATARVRTALDGAAQELGIDWADHLAFARAQD